jgi:hypothetical protein
VGQDAKQSQVDRLAWESGLRRISVKKLLGFVVVVFAFVGMSFGQAISVNGGSIQGTITDPSGAVVPGANVTITATDMGTIRVLTTDSAGFYSIGPLNPGAYNVTITHEGFQKLSVTTVVRTGTATNGNFKLPLGESSQTVEVNAGAVQVNTEQVGISGVITTAQLDTLPVNGRNILDFAQLQPGVQLQPGGDSDGGFDPTKAGYSALSFSGISGRTTRILLDGQDITDENVGTTIYNVSQGSVGEMQVNRSVSDVSGEISASGSVLASTRSGTNSFHGQLFYDFQDQRVGAATFQGVSNPFQRNQFGGSIGGPIIKDKLFFFANSERLKQDQEAPVTLASPFAAIRAQFPQVGSPDRDTYSAARLDYNGPFGMHMFARINYEANFFATGNQYSTYANRDNAPGIAAGVDYAGGKFTHSFRGSYEKFHNMITDTTAGNTNVYNPLAGIGLVYNSGAGLTSGPNPNAPQQTFQTDKQLRYDGSWTKGAHQVRFGGSLNRIQAGGLAAFFGFGPQVNLLSSGLLPDDDCDVAGTCNPATDYVPYAIQISNGQGYLSERPGFGLPGGGQGDWRTGFYLVDTWKVKPTFSLTIGARYDRDTGRTNSDLAPVLCSQIVLDNFTSAPPCSGNTQLLDQWGQGLGGRVSQPNKNVGPQIGFNYNPAAAPNTVLRGAIGIFFESNIFNNVQFDRGARLPQGEFASYPIICGNYGNKLSIPGKGVVDSTSTGVPISTICSEPAAQSAAALLQLQSDFRGGGTQVLPNTNFAGYGLTIPGGGAAAYGHYRSPYSINFNFGIQQQLMKGVVITADYVHNATLRIQQGTDLNHVGDSRYFNLANAKAAIAATLANCGAISIDAAMAPGGCPANPDTGFPGGSGGTKQLPSANMSDFASQGLDSGSSVNGGVPNNFVGAVPAAFDGVNTAVGVGTFSLPEGKAAYDGLQINLREQKSHPMRGVVDSNLEVSYAYSRFITTTGPNGIGTSDTFFSPTSYSNRNITQFMGYGSLDRTHILSLGGAITAKYGPRIGVIAHFESALPTNLTLDTQGSFPGEIYRTDVDGDGTVGDLVPGTDPGAYMRKVKPGTLNNLINNYNSSHAGTLTPAGQVLVANGLFTPAQMATAGAVQPTLANAPAQPYAFTMLRTFDANFTYPIRGKWLPEGMSLEPSVSIYNVFNFANYGGPTGTIQTPEDNSSQGNVNGPIGDDPKNTVYNTERVSRRTGSFSQGAPRATEFQLKFNF